MAQTNPTAFESEVTNLRAAVDLASKGFPVFPVWGVTPRGNCTCGRENCKHLAGGKPGKRPAVAKWQQVATTNPEMIRKWWRRYPHANIGIHANQLLVIDVDGPDGHRSLQRLLRISSKLMETATIRSGNSEPHHYQLLFRLPQFLGSIKNKPLNQFTVFGGLNKIDVKTTHGYVLGPGSRHHSGGLYSWGREPQSRECLAKAPLTLVSLLTDSPECVKPHSPKTRKKRKRKPSRGKCRRPTATGQLVAKELQNYTKQVITRFPVHGPGQRNSQMTRAVASLVGRGLHPRDVRKIMIRWLRNFRTVYGTSFQRALAELAEVTQRTLANDKFDTVNHASARDRITLPATVSETLSRQFSHSSLERMFIEALLVMFRYKPTLNEEGDLRATFRDWKRIIKSRHGKSLDNTQIHRLKRKFVTNSDRSAKKLELMEELRKGSRNLRSGRGEPSVYRATGLLTLFPSLFGKVPKQKGKK